MSGNLFYLLTILPVLPATAGDPVPVDDAMARIRDEGDGRLLFLADLLEVEAEIDRCGLNYFVQGNHDYRPQLSPQLPDTFVETFLSFCGSTESDWLTSVYAAWFELLMNTSRKTGSSFLGFWAAWEYSLRTLLRLERSKAAGRSAAELESMVPVFMKDTFTAETIAIVDTYKAISEPLKAEKFLDQARIDFLRRSAVHYSFSLDELIAYLLELRIHNRYARLNPDRGRKILEEVTTL